MAQGGEPGSSVVDGQAQALAPQAGQSLRQRVVILDGCLLGDLGTRRFRGAAASKGSSSA